MISTSEFMALLFIYFTNILKILIFINITKHQNIYVMCNKIKKPIKPAIFLYIPGLPLPFLNFVRLWLLPFHLLSSLLVIFFLYFFEIFVFNQSSILYYFFQSVIWLKINIIESTRSRAKIIGILIHDLLNLGSWLCIQI